MDKVLHTDPLTGENDTNDAQRVFEEFLLLYEPPLKQVESYLGDVIEHLGSPYADAYKPWHMALRDLLHGVYLMAKKIPLPDSESFMESLHMFSFDSAIQFLCDLCTSCRIKLQQDWAERFRKHIDQLLFAANTLLRSQSLAR